MRVRLERYHGCWLLRGPRRLMKGQIQRGERLTAEERAELEERVLTRLFQNDWDWPALASCFGFVPCECGATDGTVDCPHKTVSEMIAAAADFLAEHEGETCEDPGYFDSE